MKKANIDISSMTKIAIFIALLCICSYIVIPLPFSVSPLTLHTLVLNLCILILKPKYSTLTVFIYLLLGGIGLPIFSNGNGGIAYLLGPQGGFYLGFLLSVIITSLLIKNTYSNIKLGIILFSGLLIQHLCGIIFFTIYNQTNILSSFLTMSFPFILGDIIKIIISIMIYNTIKKALKLG